MATHSSILAWRILMDRGAWWATVHGGHKEWDMTERLSPAQHMIPKSMLGLTVDSDLPVSRALSLWLLIPESSLGKT